MKSPFKYIIFDIFNVLLTHNALAGFQKYLAEKELTDPRISREWSGDIIAVMKGMLTQYCPLCNYTLCKEYSIKDADRGHVLTALKEGKLSYEEFKVVMTYMLTHYVTCAPKVRVLLDYLAEYLSRPDLIIKNYQVMPAGVALLQHVAMLYGPEHIFILSNMPAELFALQRQKFPEIFETVPLENCLIAGHTGVIKPKPQAFEQMIAKVGAPVGTMLLIDDLLSNVEAARKLGLPAILYTPVPGVELAEWYRLIGFDARITSYAGA
jgi:FMN phosphatase YigB (HAD superfamily)